jgi:hypothetical protein
MSGDEGRSWTGLGAVTSVGASLALVRAAFATCITAGGDGAGGEGSGDDGLGSGADGLGSGADGLGSGGDGLGSGGDGLASAASVGGGTKLLTTASPGGGVECASVPLRSAVFTDSASAAARVSSKGGAGTRRPRIAPLTSS